MILTLGLLYEARRKTPVLSGGFTAGTTPVPFLALRLCSLRVVIFSLISAWHVMEYVLLQNRKENPKNGLHRKVLMQSAGL